MTRRGELAPMPFPRPGPALKWVLAAIAVVGVLEAILINWVGSTKAFEVLVCSPADVLHGQVWRLLTAGFLTEPEHYGHLVFTLIGLYFLSTDLEKRWGAGRFLRFLAAAIVFGFALSVVFYAVAPASLGALHLPMMLGANAAITATAVAWSRMNARSQVLLMFVLPVSGRALFWITLGYCVLGVIYPPASLPEGMVAPFGGLITGMLLTGEPSPLRRWYLQTKLALLRGRGGRTMTAHEIAFGTKPRKARPPLRVVRGGSDDDEDPKDKRYLN